MSDVLTTFESSLDGLDVATTRTDVDGFAEALDDAIQEPAVGIPLGLDDVSLADTAVTVDPTAAALESARTGVTPSKRASPPTARSRLHPTRRAASR